MLLSPIFRPKTIQEVHADEAKRQREKESNVQRIRCVFYRFLGFHSSGYLYSNFTLDLVVPRVSQDLLVAARPPRSLPGPRNHP